MIANYHTHTWRCNHAYGTEEEYVQAAVLRGLQVLGFADHAPYCFPDGYYSGFRMKPEETLTYASHLLNLREKYASRIDIRIGVEIEYYPAFFSDTVLMLCNSQVEYMILGQHFVGNEIGEPYSGKATADEALLQRYCHQVMDAMNTGMFTYVAHPDVFRFEGDAAVYEKHFRRLCREARACGIPLEINLLGLNESRHYPTPLFWKIAAEEGCTAILGCDAHTPEALLDVETEKRALKMAKRLGITVLDSVPLRHI